LVRLVPELRGKVSPVGSGGPSFLVVAVAVLVLLVWRHHRTLLVETVVRVSHLP
jgi:hypothetical protein